MTVVLGIFNPFFLIAPDYFLTLMQARYLISFFLLLFIVSGSQAQLFRLRKKVNEEDVERRVGIARIKLEARPPKGTSIADIASFPEFFGERSGQIKYQKQSLIRKLPPTTGDSLREVTSDSLALYLRQNLYDWDATGENRESVRKKKNNIHDLPNEDFQKYLSDSLLDEAIDIACLWYFSEDKSSGLFRPEVQMKVSFFDKNGPSRPAMEAVLAASDMQCAHFYEAYGTGYDFSKGITSKEAGEGGIAGNVVVDVYLQALKKLLARK